MAAENPALWSKPAEMQKMNKEKSILEKAFSEWNQFYTKFEDAKVLLEMAVEAFFI